MKRASLNRPRMSSTLSGALDGLRFAFGTFTRIPVRAPKQLSVRTAAWGICLAPLVGLLLSLIAEALALATRWAIPGWDDRLLVAVIAIAALAALTGGIHLDGLTDTADGLASGADADRAVAIMRRSDVGALGVITVVLVLLMQIAALNTALLAGRGTLALVGGAVVSRLAIVWACRRGTKAARSDGLGATVIGSVPLAAVAVVTVVAALVLAFGAIAEDDVARSFVVNILVALVLSLAAGEVVRRYCERRLGGLTGDVLGAINEVTFLVFVFAVALR